MSTRERTPAQRRRTTIVTIAAIVGVVLVAILVAYALLVTSTPEFFSRYHLLNRRYVNLEGSAHEGIGCRTCHETSPLVNGPQLVAEYYVGLFGRGEVPRYFTFRSPSNEQCQQCHIDDWSDDAARTKRIPHPAHARVASETRQCTGCHKWTAHLETYMEKHKKMPFSGVCVSYGCHVGTKQTDQCYDCHHVLATTSAEWDKKHPEVVQRAGQNGCLESCHVVEHCQTCHTTGKPPKIEGLPIQVGLDVEKLHVKPEWLNEYHGTEALKNRAECLLCHQSEGECEECHRYRPAFHGKPLTWIGRHSKSTEDVKDPRCLECHEEAFCKDCHEEFKKME